MYKLTAFVFPLLCLLNVSPRPTKTDVTVGMGSRGANCSGSGVCTISSSGGGGSLTGHRAELGYDPNGKMYLQFRIADLPTEVYAAQFGSAQFTMQSDCPLPPEVLDLLGSGESGLSLKTGTYPILITTQSVRVTF